MQMQDINNTVAIPVEAPMEVLSSTTTKNETATAKVDTAPAQMAVKAPVETPAPVEAPATEASAVKAPTIVEPPVAIASEDVVATTPSRANGIKNGKSPRAKKRRSGSVSSSSSLSSVPDEIFSDIEEYDLAVSRPRSAEGNETPNPAGSSQPIRGAQARSANKRKNASPKPATHPSNTTRTHPSSSTSNMPTAAANGASNRGSRNTHQTTLKFPSKYGEPDAKPGDLTRDRVAKRAKSHRITKSVTEESFVRGGTASEEPAEEPPTPLLPTVVAPVEQPRQLRTPALSSRATRAAKRNQEDVEGSVSPTTASFTAALDLPSSRRNSRAATPSNLRSAKKPRGGLRVKTS